MAKSKKPNFLNKLLRKSSKSEDDEELDETPQDSEEPPEFDEKQSSNSEMFYEDMGYQDDDIEKALEDRPETDIETDFEDDEEDEDIDFEQQHVFQLSDEQKKELDDLDHTQEQSAPDFNNNGDPSSERDIDLEKIKNYQMTEEDEAEDQTLGSYREFTPTHEQSFTKAQQWLARLKKLSPFALLASIKALGGKKGKPSSGGGFQWDQFVESIFGPNSRPHVHKIFLIALIVSTTYCLGKVAAIILRGAPETRAPRQTQAPQTPQTNWRMGINKVKTANLFNAKMVEKSQKKEPQKKQRDPVDKNLVCDSANKASDLPIKLLNTVVLQDSVKSIASVQVRGNRELKNIREGEKINGIAEVGKISRLNMILKNLNTGECEYVTNREYEKQQKRHDQKQLDIVSPEQGKKLMQNKDDRIENEGNKYTIKKSVRNEMLGNINEVLTQARAIQIKNPDGSYSFKMTEIVPGSIYSKLGLQNGDIITGINGDKIQNVNQLMSMFGQIKDIDQFELKIKRNGAEQTQEYTFQ